jgi:hypothetical protein
MNDPAFAVTGRDLISPIFCGFLLVHPQSAAAQGLPARR